MSALHPERMRVGVLMAVRGDLEFRRADRRTNSSLGAAGASPSDGDDDGGSDEAHSAEGEQDLRCAVGDRRVRLGLPCAQREAGDQDDDCSNEREM